jgi:membrane protease YdiL (CAAX protease family)
MDPHPDQPQPDGRQPPAQQAPPPEVDPAHPQAGAPGFWSPEQPPPWGAPQPPSPLGPQQPQYGQQPGYPQYGPYVPAPYGMRVVEPRVVPAPPGTPFHRLARNAKYRWWRPLLGSLFLLVGVVFLSSAVVIAWVLLHAMITGSTPETNSTDFFPSDLENLSLTLVMLAVLTPLVLLTTWLIQRRPAFSVASVLNRIRWRWLLLSLAPAAIYLMLNYGLGLALDAGFPSSDTEPTNDGSWIGLASFIGPAVLILVLVPFQSAAEEFVFRGWLVQAIGAYGPDNTTGNSFVRALKLVLRSPWPALVVSSVLFFLAHGYSGWARLDIFLFAMTIGWLTIRTGGLEAGIALHALNNIVAFMLPAATGQLSGWDDQGGAPWTLVAMDVPCLAVYAFAVLWLAKRRKITRVT